MIGITGGVASGKSLVAQQLVGLGAGLLDADRAGHEVLQQPHIEATARQRWGDAIFGPDGRIDRARLARIVFADPPDGPKEREYLEQLTHPEIARRLGQQAEALAASGVTVAVLDAPLLLEAGWDKLCRELLFVDAPRQVRLSRALARGWSKEVFAAREGVQKSLDFKRKRADVVVDNAGSSAETLAQIRRYWQSLVG
ncbi:MAG: dephospho-CoA kinase [Pirellulales bacterium]|nr:dephospho-CoA kinase [Pirellulales bacterium]